VLGIATRDHANWICFALRPSRRDDLASSGHRWLAIRIISESVAEKTQRATLINEMVESD
jgi:hypothetical protein